MTELEARCLRKQYYDGTLSAADTRKLARFVLSDACPEAWRSERRMFAALLSPPALPEGFMQRLQQTVEAAAREAAEERSVAARCEVVQVIGSKFVLYRMQHDKTRRKIELVKAKKSV